MTSHQWLAAVHWWYHLAAAVAWFVRIAIQTICSITAAAAVILYAARATAAAAAAAAARHYEPFSIIPFSLCDTSTAASDMILQGASFLLI